MLTHFSISQQGKRHIEKSMPCQDFSISKRIQVDRFGCELVIAAVSDGVGSCEYSQFGSETAVQSFLRCVEHNILNQLSELSGERILHLIEHSFHYALSQIEKEAEKRELPFLEFDSTLTGIVYDGHTLWYGHIGDDGIVVLYSDGNYEMITNRHKGEDAHSLFPLRETALWQFGKSSKEVASCVLMTDGVLDYCVDGESMGNRVYFPFLEPALTQAAFTDEEAEKQRLDWDQYFADHGDPKERFRDAVTDDISFVVVQNPDLLKELSPIPFDFDKWDEDTARRRKELDDNLYADYRAYKAGTYQSPTEQAAGYSSGKASAPVAASDKDQKIVLNKPYIERDERFLKREDEDAEDISYVDEADTVVDNLCTEAAETLKDLFRTAHSVGKLFRKQLTFKKVKNASVQKPPVANQRAGSTSISTTSSNPSTAHLQNMAVDSMDRTDPSGTDEQQK